MQNITPHHLIIFITYGCKLQLELLRMGAIAPETCRAKKYRGIKNT
jgi:hypothetical protein